MVTIPAAAGPEAIVRIARPLDGAGELDQLTGLLGRARFVLLGEATSGTHEFHELRAQLTRKLLVDHGFTAVAVDADWPDALRVDRYVRHMGEDRTADAALAGLRRFPRWIWRNRDVEAFVEWMHGDDGRERAAGEPGFYGLDVYSLHASMAAVLSYLDDVDPAAAAITRDSYARFDQMPPIGSWDRVGLAPDLRDDVIAQLIDLQWRHVSRSGRCPGGDAWFNVMSHAQVVRNADAYYRAMLDGRAAWNQREHHLAQTLDLLAERLGQGGKPAKLIVWAHNAHVGDARATAMGPQDRISLGGLMRERHPEQVALVGFTTHIGAVACAPDWDRPVASALVSPSLPGSWEALFHGTGIARFLVTSAALLRALGQRGERLHRTIGAVYWPETERHSHYYLTRLADQYDVVVHLDETHAVEPLDGPRI